MHSLKLLFRTSAVLALLSPAVAFTAPTSKTVHPSQRTSALASSSSSDATNGLPFRVGPSEPDSSAMNRRTILQQAITATSTAAFTTLLPQSANAASEKPPPIIPLITTAQRLRRVPVFTIVDGQGTPFHTYDKDSAGGFGYFFTSYTSATYVLDDAKKAFEKAKTEAANKAKKGESAEGSIGEDGQDDVPDAWGQAQIVTLPLDVVMQLSVKKTQSVAQNGKGKKFDTYYQVIPATEDLNAALRIENGPRYSERGRVPLFYINGLTIPYIESDGTSSQKNPVYFRIKDLLAEYKQQNPNATTEEIAPKIKVRELNETFRAMIRPGGKDESVRDMMFVPIPESVDKAKDCGRNYKLGEMILTK